MKKILFYIGMFVLAACSCLGSTVEETETLE